MTKTTKRGMATKRKAMMTGLENQDHRTGPHPPGMATEGDSEEGMATTATTTTTTWWTTRARYPGTEIGKRDKDNDKEMG
jgi:hypothetical protein